MINFKMYRLGDLVTKDDGIAILEQGEGFGGGQLQEYGINSNTSANGFMKCTYKKKVSNPVLAFLQPSKSSFFNDLQELVTVNQSSPTATPSKKADIIKRLDQSIKKTQAKADLASNESNQSDDENAIDSEREEIEMTVIEPVDQPDHKQRGKVHKYTPYDCFKDLVNCS